MELRFQLKQQQKLIMTQQMRQAIKLLQLNSAELEQALESELLENPSLELVPDETPLSEKELELHQKSAQEKTDLQEQLNGKAEDDSIWQALLERDDRNEAFVHNMGGGFIYNDLPPIENNLSSSETLTNKLMEQLGLEYCTDEEKIAAEFIIGNLDERGYLDCTYEEIIEMTGVELDDVEGAVLIIRELEPIGCSARNLAECLSFQAEIRYPEDPFFSDLILNHLKLLEKRAYKKISLHMDMDVEDVEEYHKMLKDFEPCPGRQFVDVKDQTITPDIKVMKVDDEWQVVSNDNGLPKIRISQLFRKLHEIGSAPKGDKKFLEDKLKSAKFLIESIYKRERTIAKVMESILIRQIDFFEKGPEYLQPLVLREIASDIGVHESTVSRVTSRKYVECSQGVFELKSFFSSGIQKIGGMDIASSSVKVKIKYIIEEENKRKPLSDNAIVKILAEQGLQIARRTVTKYREALGILSSRERKIRD